MKVLFITGLAVQPQIMGGAQQSADTVLKGLVARGYDVRMVAALLPGGVFGSVARIRVKLNRDGWAKDKHLGYVTYRAWDITSTLPFILEHWRPDVAVVLTKNSVMVARVLKEHNVPFVFALQDNEVDYVGGNFEDLGSFSAIANSQFTSTKYYDTFGINSEVIFPICNKDNYWVDRIGNSITFINPHPLKGLAKFLEIASLMPDDDFLVVEGWKLRKDEIASLLESFENLPNVRLMRSTNDMREVFSQTKLLLVPSQWEEGYGRVVTEAQISGIPVVGSDRGGLPEAIGLGGKVIPADAPAERWVSEIRSILGNADEFREVSNAAIKWANRPELDFDFQMAKWEGQIKLAYEGRAQMK